MAARVAVINPSENAARSKKEADNLFTILSSVNNSRVKTQYHRLLSLFPSIKSYMGTDSINYGIVNNSSSIYNVERGYLTDIPIPNYGGTSKTILIPREPIESITYQFDGVTYTTNSGAEAGSVIIIPPGLQLVTLSNPINGSLIVADIQGRGKIAAV